MCCNIMEYILDSIASGSGDVVTNPILINIFGMSVSESGIASLSIFGGEIIASIILTKYSSSIHKVMLLKGQLCIRSISKMLGKMTKSNTAMFSKVDKHQN